MFTFAAGAIDSGDRPSGISALDETPFVAPGEHVYVWHPSAAPTPATVSCEPPPYTGATLPAAFSGSSVAAALTAGAVARIQETRFQAAQLPLSRETAERLLYLTGSDTCREMHQYPIRRLSITRLEQGLACASLVACAEGSHTPVSRGGELLTQCRNTLASCGLETLTPNGDDIARPCPSLTVPRLVEWPQNYGPVHDANSCAPLLGSAPAETSCATPPCPWEDRPLRSLIGSTGPHPTDPVCPDCLVTRQASTAHLSLELYGGFDDGTTFTSPYLAVSSSSGEEYWIALPEGEVAWLPGKSLSLDIELSNDVAAADWYKTSLSLTVHGPDGTEAIDVSALRLKNDF